MQLAPRSVKMEAVTEEAAPARARATAQLSTELIAEIEADKAHAAEIEAAAAAAAAGVPAVEPPVVGITGEATLDLLFGKLAATEDAKGATLLLEELASRIEVHAREGKIVLVLRAIEALLEREAAIADPDLRRAYVVTQRRVFRPQVLRVVMPASQREHEFRGMLTHVLDRAAEDGAIVVFEEIQRSRTLAERAELVALLKGLPAALPVLLKLLSDPRWFVVRTAVELVGDIGTTEAERAIADAFKHSDERVHRTAAATISRFETSFTVDALYRALADPSAQVRLQAVHGLAARRGDSKAASVVVNAIDDEPEVEVQLAEIAALGRFATSDAVGKLARAAEPDGRLFRRKNPAYRVAAVQALAEARTPAAMATLQNLLNDRDREVRDAVGRLMHSR